MKPFRTTICFLFYSVCLLGIGLASCKDSPASKNTFKVVVYLNGCDSSRVPEYTNILKKHPLVREVAFISKEKAKEKYLNDGNDDWSKVLKENPLPDSFELQISQEGFSDEEIPLFKKFVTDAIPCTIDISIPLHWSLN